MQRKSTGIRLKKVRLLDLLILIISLAVGIYVVGKNQDIRNRAYELNDCQILITQNECTADNSLNCKYFECQYPEKSNKCDKNDKTYKDVCCPQGNEITQGCGYGCNQGFERYCTCINGLGYGNCQCRPNPSCPTPTPGDEPGGESPVNPTIPPQTKLPSIAPQKPCYCQSTIFKGGKVTPSTAKPGQIVTATCNFGILGTQNKDKIEVAGDLTDCTFQKFTKTILSYAAEFSCTAPSKPGTYRHICMFNKTTTCLGPCTGSGSNYKVK